MKNAKAKGAMKERASKALLEAEGYFVTKAGGSLGAADLVALRAGDAPLLVQVKASSRPYENFRPEERAEFRRVADQAGAVPVLAWWKPRAREHLLVDETAWPEAALTQGVLPSERAA